MLFKIDMQYLYQTEYWTNVFYVDVADYGAAQSAVIDLAEVLKTGIQNSVSIDKARITPAPFTRDTFRDVVLGISGTGGATQPAPLFNVVRWQFAKPVGRAINMYFRGGVTPSNIGPDQEFTEAAQTFNNALLAAIFDLPVQFVSRAGTVYTTATAAPKVGMRQLRRGSRRKTTPVI